MGKLITLPPPKLIVTEKRTPFYVTEPEVDAWLAYERSFSYVRETDPNCGPEVEVFQAFCYGKKGDSWCDDFQCFCYFGVWPNIPLKRSGRCQTTRELAEALGWLLPFGTYPKRGDLGFCVTPKKTPRGVPPNHAHHIFAVEHDPRPSGAFDTLEGNTNPSGGSNGFGMFPRTTRSMKLTTIYQFVRFPRLPLAA